VQAEARFALDPLDEEIVDHQFQPRGDIDCGWGRGRRSAERQEQRASQKKER
jgi:hypothetical protein